MQAHQHYNMTNKEKNGRFLVIHVQRKVKTETLKLVSIVCVKGVKGAKQKIP